MANNISEILTEIEGKTVENTWMNDSATLYDLALVKKVFNEVLELQEGCSWLAMKWDNTDEEGNPTWIDFCLFEFNTGIDDKTLLKKIWYGSGISGNLREFRHSYFGDGDGYVFYAPLEAMALSIGVLRKYFD